MKRAKYGYHHTFRNALIPRYINYWFWLIFDNSFAFFYHLINKEEVDNLHLNVKDLKWKMMHSAASRRTDRRVVEIIMSPNYPEDWFECKKHFP